MQFLQFFAGCLVVVLRTTGLFFGPFLLWAASLERDRAEGVYETPTPVSYEELVSDVPLDNRHVAVKDLAIRSEGYCYQARSSSDEEVIACVPAYSASIDEEPPASEMRLILKVWNVRGEADLHEKIKAGPVVGILDYGHYPIAYAMWSILEENYPGIDVDKCRLLIVGGAFPSLTRAKVFAWMGGGISLGAVGAWLLRLRAWRAAKREHAAQEPIRIAARAAIDQTF